MRQGRGGWVVEVGSPYDSYANTTMSCTFSSPQLSPSPYSPAFSGSPNTPPSGTTAWSQSHGLGLGPSSRIRSSLLSPHTPVSPFPTGATAGTPYDPCHGVGTPSTPPTQSLYSHFPPPPTPGSATGGGSVFAQQQGGAPPPPPRGSSGLRHASNGSPNGAPVSGKKDD